MSTSCFFDLGVSISCVGGGRKGEIGRRRWNPSELELLYHKIDTFGLRSAIGCSSSPSCTWLFNPYSARSIKSNFKKISAVYFTPPAPRKKFQYQSLFLISLSPLPSLRLTNPYSSTPIYVIASAYPVAPSLRAKISINLGHDACPPPHSAHRHCLHKTVGGREALGVWGYRLGRASC